MRQKLHVKENENSFHIVPGTCSQLTVALLRSKAITTSIQEKKKSQSIRPIMAHSKTSYSPTNSQLPTSHFSNRSHSLPSPSSRTTHPSETARRVALIVERAKTRKSYPISRPEFSMTSVTPWHMAVPAYLPTYIHTPNIRFRASAREHHQRSIIIIPLTYTLPYATLVAL